MQAADAEVNCLKERLSNYDIARLVQINELRNRKTCVTSGSSNPRLIRVVGPELGDMLRSLTYSGNADTELAHLARQCLLLGHPGYLPPPAPQSSRTATRHRTFRQVAIDDLKAALWELVAHRDTPAQMRALTKLYLVLLNAELRRRLHAAGTED